MVSNTEKWANPIYKMTSRKEGDLEANMGKFQQYWLEEVEVSEARDEAASLMYVNPASCADALHVL